MGNRHSSVSDRVDCTSGVAKTDSAIVGVSMAQRKPVLSGSSEIVRCYDWNVRKLVVELDAIETMLLLS